MTVTIRPIVFVQLNAISEIVLEDDASGFTTTEATVVDKGGVYTWDVIGDAEASNDGARLTITVQCTTGTEVEDAKRAELESGTLLITLTDGPGVPKLSVDYVPDDPCEDE